MIAHKITIKMRNDDCYQVGKYLILKELDIFKAHQINIITDEDTLKVKENIKANDYNESFIALEIDLKIYTSALSK